MNKEQQEARKFLEKKVSESVLIQPDVIKSVCECGSTKINITNKDKPFCFLCGKDW